VLVLSRRPGQSLWLGSEVEVRLLRVEGDRVVLGVSAPRRVVVVRGELHQRVAGEVRAASHSRRDGRLAAAVAALGRGAGR